MLKNLVFLTVCSVLLISTVGFSQDGNSDDIFKKKYIINVNKKKTEINIDGVLREDAWSHAEKAELNYEFMPRNNVKPEVNTDVYFLYDASNLYVGFICYENDMSNIRANITERDNIFDDDMVVLLLDTFNDQKIAYEIFVNPYGIQGDGIWNMNNEDMSYDMIWFSDAKMYDDRWTIEMKIPFKSLTFPKGNIQNWRLHIARMRPRSSRQQISWIPIDRDNPVILEQAGWLKGLTNIQRGKVFQLLPYTIASNQGERLNIEVPESDFKEGKIKSDFGMGVKYGLSSNLNLNFVYNPDFSQIESDPTQIDVNNTHALYFSERRPFFLEGNEAFRTHLNNDIIYTRTINNPIFAAKLTGKIGDVQVGYISAYDRNTPYIIPLEDRSSSFATNKNSFSNILRLKYDLSGESYIGGVITNREGEAGFNRLGSIDARFQFLKNYYFDFQYATSSTLEPKNPDLYESDNKFSDKDRTATFDGEKFNGKVIFATFRRRAENVNLSIYYRDYSPTFRAGNGFVRSNNYRYYEVNFDFDFYPNNKILDNYSISPEFSQEYNYQNQLKNHRYELNLFGRFKKQTILIFNYEYENTRFDNILFKNLYSIFFMIESKPTKYLTLGTYNSLGKDIYRTSEDPRKALSKSLEIYIKLRPTSNFNISAGAEKFILDELNNNGNIFDGHTFRTIFNYQYNRNLYLRIISQYNSFSKSYEIDPLIRYKLNPFTIFYIGSTYDFKKFDDPHGLTKLQRQYFMKLQYLVQM